MLTIIAKAVGTILLLCGTFFFFVFTVDMTSNVRIAGPMNLWPPPLWVYLILDTIFLLLAVSGIKLTGLKRIVTGSLMSIIGVLVLIFVFKNQLKAPPREAMSDGRYLAADIQNYVVAYVIAELLLVVGLWFIIQHFRRRRLK
jgi:hypothetical protein